MKILKHIILLSFLFVFWGCSNDRKVDYQLQEQCGKQCEVFYQNINKVHQDNPSTGINLIGYQNHYNKKLNKCFILMTFFNEHKKNIILMDVNERKAYGSFEEESLCNVSEKKCKSEDEWKLLIKPYMEE